MSILEVTEVGTELSATLIRVRDQKERVIVQHCGQPVAVLVPIDDLEVLEQLEDRIDLKETRKILADPTEEYRPWEEVKVELGL